MKTKKELVALAESGVLVPIGYYSPMIGAWLEIYDFCHDQDKVFGAYAHIELDGSTARKYFFLKLNYAKPDWSDEQLPYFVYDGSRYYLAEFLTTSLKEV